MRRFGLTNEHYGLGEWSVMEGTSHTISWVLESQSPYHLDLVEVVHRWDQPLYLVDEVE